MDKANMCFFRKRLLRRRRSRPHSGYDCIAVVRLAAMATAGCFFAHALRADPAGSIEQLQASVTELIALQKAAYTATADWEVQKAQLDAHTDLLERRISRLRTEGEIAEKARLERTEKQAHLQNELAADRTALLSCAASLPKIESRLKAIAPRLPPPLLNALKESLEALPGEACPVTVDGLATRLQQVLTLLTEIRQFDAGIHVEKELIAFPDGKKQEMDVLYIGLGTAFAVSHGRETAGRASATPDGWEWEWNPEWASPIRRVIEIHQKEQPAAFVPLPLKFARDAQ